MDKWEKVVLFHRLLTRSVYTVSKEKILSELECSEATFHRIRSFMQSNLGAPIVFDCRYGGYRYDKTGDGPFELPGLWFTRNEIEALLCLDHAVESMQGSFFGDILAPMKKRFEPLLKAQKTRMAALRERIRIIPIQSRQIDEHLFRTVAGAVMRKRALRIEHAKLPDEAPTSRIISPQALVRYRDNWYVDAFCHLRNELRTFALNRIESAVPAHGKFHSVSLDRLHTFFADSYGIFTGPADKKAVIDFTGTAAREVSKEQWHPRQQGNWVDDKTYRLTVPYGHSRELVMDILRWGSDAEVIGPKELRKTLKTTVAGIQKKYGK